MKKKILIYIHKSLGELDWVAPFVSSPEAEEFDFYIYLNKVGNDPIEKELILRKYGLKKDNISLIANAGYFKRCLKLIDRRMKRLERMFSFFKKHHEYFIIKSGDYLKFGVGFDYIFRDYSLNEGFELSCFLKRNKKAKIVVYPHAVGIQRINPLSGFVDKTPTVSANLWLENTEYSTRHKPKYGDIFFASGAPALSSRYEKESLFSSVSPNIIFVTSHRFEAYGYTREKALMVFNQALMFCEKNNFTMYVKHHPRDSKIDEYRSLQRKYQCVKEIDSTLNDLKGSFRACLSLFSTAGLFLTARRIPVIDVTPYDASGSGEPLYMHYFDSNGELTHDLIEIGVQKRLEGLSILFSGENLTKLSETQFVALKRSFPDNSNEKIVLKLKSL